MKICYMMYKGGNVLLAVDKTIILQYIGTLKEILLLELKAGNHICETYKGDWPCNDCIMIFLEKPFLTPIQKNLATIEFHNINDPHYWKAEYYDKETNQFLCCGFGGIPDFNDM